MTHDPYSPPQSPTEEFAVTAGPTPVRRPPLVWFTQILLAMMVLMAFVGVVMALVMFASASTPVPPLRLALGLLFTAAEVGLLGTLFFGLAYRRRWAWHGSMAFSVLVMLWFFWTRSHPVNGPIPKFEIKPEEMLGAATAELMMSFLVLWYPVRMFFSRKVRLFLGVRPYGQRDAT